MSAKKKLTHVDARGEARMVDVGEKDRTHRFAVARAVVHTKGATIRRLRDGDTPKGDVLAVARIAGIAAAKATSSLIPLCHPISLTKTRVDIALRTRSVEILATCEALDRTGVEMEAMTAASVAALALYDMLKAIDRGITFEVRLEEKRGGKSGAFTRSKRGRGA